MLGRRAAGIYIVLVLIFTGMLCRMYALSMGETLSSAANTQSAFVLGVDDTRGIIYDCKLRPLVGEKTHLVAAIQPSPEAFTALTEAREKGLDAPLPDEGQTKPYLMEIGRAHV